MTDAMFDDIYGRLDALTEDVASLKIQAGTAGTTQVAVGRTLTLVTALSSEFRILRAEMQRVKAQNDEILRILRDRNGGTGTP